jgi:xylulokinase
MSAQPLLAVEPDTVIAGLDFSTGSVKGLLFNLDGTVRHEVRLPTDLWTEGGVSELNVLQLEGQVLSVMRQLAGDEMSQGAVGISATHHTAGPMAGYDPIRRMICWNDQSLAKYHAEGLARLGGQQRAIELTGGPWAVRYSLSHLIKDEQTLSEADWERTRHLVQHGSFVAGYLVGDIYSRAFEKISVSAAASTGMMDLRTNQWRREMLDALADPKHREMIWDRLPTIVEMNEPLGKCEGVKNLFPKNLSLPLVFPSIDDQAAGLIGGGAVDPGQIAIILGNSAVVNSSSSKLPASGNLDCMKTNWGTYLWMRCYSNGAQFLDRVVGAKPDWDALEKAARAVPAGCGDVAVLPFALSEPSIGVNSPRFEWIGGAPTDKGIQLRASFEAIAYLIGLGVQEHEAAGQVITRITVSGGIAQNDLMCEILASVLNKPLERLESNEGTALGAAVVALAGLESCNRKQQKIAEPFTAADAVAHLVRFRGRTEPRADWAAVYAERLKWFRTTATSAK